jgi:hypothetical protein
LAAAFFAVLHWRTLHRSVAAKDTTIPSFGFEYGFAIFAFVKKLTGISGHSFFFLMLTIRTGDG